MVHGTLTVDTLYFCILFDCVNEFQKFDTIISNTEKLNPIYTGQCEDFIANKSRGYNDEDKNFFKFCSNSGHYVTELIAVPKNKIYPFCIYMIYWIYHGVISKDKGKYSGLVKEFFDFMHNIEVCEKYAGEIDQGIYEELKALDDLYDNFNNFKTESLLPGTETCEKGTTCVDLYKRHVDECNENYKNGFCMKLIDFKKEYEQHMAILTSSGNMPRYLPSIGSNIATSVSIPVGAISLISLISFVSFISYKYTPLGSWIHPKLTGGKKRMNNLHKETEKIQYTSEYQENPYRISYQPSRYS